MPPMPAAPIAVNHTIITGPKSEPTRWVPYLWAANSSTMITAVIGTTYWSKEGSTSLSPSTAESTEIAGVIMLSPKNREAPKIAERRQDHLGPAGAAHRLAAGSG